MKGEIQVKATVPVAVGQRVYNLGVNGYKFLFEMDNPNQEVKSPHQILRDELDAIVKVLDGVLAGSVGKLPAPSTDDTLAPGA